MTLDENILAALKDLTAGEWRDLSVLLSPREGQPDSLSRHITIPIPVVCNDHESPISSCRAIRHVPAVALKLGRKRRGPIKCPSGSSRRKEFLLPAVKDRGMKSMLIAKVRDRNPSNQVRWRFRMATFSLGL